MIHGMSDLNFRMRFMNQLLQIKKYTEANVVD